MHFSTCITKVQAYLTAWLAPEEWWMAGAASLLLQCLTNCKHGFVGLTHGQGFSAAYIN
jgi:hypothetical protein